MIYALNPNGYTLSDTGKDYVAATLCDEYHIIDELVFCEGLVYHDLKTMHNSLKKENNPIIVVFNEKIENGKLSGMTTRYITDSHIIADLRLYIAENIDSNKTSIELIDQYMSELNSFLENKMKNI